MFKKCLGGRRRLPSICYGLCPCWWAHRVRTVANNLSGSFSLRFNPREAHSTEIHHQVPAAAMYTPGARERLKNTINSCSNTPVVVKCCERGNRKLHHIPARVTSSGIKVFSHDTLLPITDSGSVQKKKKCGGGGGLHICPAFV